jgi:hypothetical protein
VKFLPSRAAPVLVLSLACLFAALLASVATNYDFRAFYCAGTALREHQNPYNVQPLRNCEVSLPNDPFKPYSRTVALPAPLPGYALAAFMPISRLPFSPAGRLWTGLLLLSIALAVCSLATLTGLSAAAVACAFLVSLCAGSIGFGEVVPVCVAAICASGVFAQRRQWVACSLVASLALIEPHIGLPIVLCLLICVKAARATLITTIATLGAASLVALGPTWTFEYLTAVLPAHALSELSSEAQLSLSAISYALGAAPARAVAIGAVSYLIAMVCGILTGYALSRRFNSNAFLIFAPAAFSLIGGTFIHVTQLAAALPLALLLSSHEKRYRPVFLTAALLLAVPWRLAGTPLLIAAATLAIAYVAWEASGKNLRMCAACATGALAILLLINVFTGEPRHTGTSKNLAGLINPVYAEAGWARYNEAYLSGSGADRWLRRIPSWLGLLLLGGGATAITIIRPAIQRAAPVYVRY